jgi:ABC-type uncharacterized transport system permease subunit
MPRAAGVFDAGVKGQEAASAYADYMASAAPSAAGMLKDMAPAMLFAAPLAVALAAAIAQFHEMKKNKACCVELGARLVALQGILNEIKTRNARIVETHKSVFERMIALVKEGTRAMAAVEAWPRVVLLCRGR